MKELVERKQCPWCLSENHWEVLDWDSVRNGPGSTHINEKLICRNIVEWSNVPGETTTCNCTTNIEYDHEEEFVPELER